MAGICDRFQRGIDYLRISVTDRCNLRCIYCMPPEGVLLVNRRDILSFEEIQTIVRAASELGIDKVRITGGEPLVRLHITELIRMISGVDGIKEISMTTNGILLAKYAAELQQAGLRRVNVSLDTLKAGRFRDITRAGELTAVLKGIEAAREVGLNPIKINMVPMKGINDDEIVDFAKMTIEAGWHVRFIELMPFAKGIELIPADIQKKQIELLGKMEPYFGIVGAGPARYYRLPGANGTIGFISAISEPFCERCNRLRLSATGILYPCLFSENGMDLRTYLRRGITITEVKALITQAASLKPQQHQRATGNSMVKNMSRIGG